MIVDDLSLQNEKLTQNLNRFRENLRKVDHQLDTVEAMSVTTLKSWYFQHLLLTVIERFSANQTVSIPKYMSQFENCFKDDFGMMKIWRHLLTVESVDVKILKPAFDDLINAMSTQMLNVEVDDQLSKWVLTSKTK